MPEAGFGRLGGVTGTTGGPPLIPEQRLADLQILFGLIILLVVMCMTPQVFSQDQAEKSDGYAGTRPQLTVGQFMHELSQHGEWFHLPDWGWTWQPHDIQPWWVPYTEGEWQASVDGPYWVSYKPYGWAVFHYGRWMEHDDFGWVWLPDTRWGPAFVCWRQGHGYVGWAPMPPQSPGDVGIASGECDVDADAWSFILGKSAFERNVEHYIVPRARNANLAKVTKPLTNFREGGMGWKDTSFTGAEVSAMRKNKVKVKGLQLVLSPPQNYQAADRQKSIPTYAPVLSGDAPAKDGPFDTQPADEPMQPGFKAASNADAMRVAHLSLLDYQGVANERLRAMHMHDLQFLPWPGFDPKDLPAWHAAELKAQIDTDVQQRDWIDTRFLIAWPDHPFVTLQPWHERYGE